jgi:hypothetical protein
MTRRWQGDHDLVAGDAHRQGSAGRGFTLIELLPCGRVCRPLTGKFQVPAGGAEAAEKKTARD